MAAGDTTVGSTPWSQRPAKMMYTKVHITEATRLLRHRLTDAEWEAIHDLFPPRAHTGRPPRDRRQIFDAILWILRTGAPWRDLPAEFGPWATAWDLFDKWNADGTLDAILSHLRAARIDAGEIDGELWCIDGTVVRAAQCAAGGAKSNDPDEPADHALGRSRGGFSTKIHILCDGHGHPLHFHLTAGQAHETTALVPFLEGADERVVGGDGEPLAWPATRGTGRLGSRSGWKRA